MFEIKSSIISDILDNIVTLYSLGKISESNNLQDNFNKLLENGDLVELKNLLDESNKKVQHYRLELLRIED
jgi:putative GTP pyrophosphokinase